MAQRKKGFTLVEVIVVLVILAILAGIMIPAMTGWIDKAKERRLVVACRACVAAAQTLVSETYGTTGTVTPPDVAAVIDLAGVPGTASNISVDAASAMVDVLTYSDGTESMTYTRLPSPQYHPGVGLAGTMATVSEWAKQYYALHPTALNKSDNMTIAYGDTKPSALSAEQVTAIFGNKDPEGDAQYIYPMAVRTQSGELLNVQYVTPVNPASTTGFNRCQASAFIIDGKTYVCTLMKNGEVRAINNCSKNELLYFQNLTNKRTYESTQEFVDLLTTNGGYYQLVE